MRRGRAGAVLFGLVSSLMGPGVLGAQTTAPDPVDPLMGEYAGQYLPEGGAPLKGLGRVFPLGEGLYRARLTAGTETVEGTQIPKKPVLKLNLHGVFLKGKLPLGARLGEVEWSGMLEGGRLAASSEGKGRFELKRIERRSPTAGLKAPEGAIVLLPLVMSARKSGPPRRASDDGPPPLAEWTNDTWKALPGGVMAVGKKDNSTRREFGDIRLHLEFRIPYEPAGRGQGRGNSGVYLMDRYEIQILDSFGLDMGGGDCGCFYHQARVPFNVCLPPLVWQTYDVTWRAPRFDEKGAVVRFPQATVLHNGIKIHDRATLRRPTGGARDKRHVKTAPLRLQDHRHPVQYRNIWVVELTDEPGENSASGK